MFVIQVNFEQSALNTKKKHTFCEMNGNKNAKE